MSIYNSYVVPPQPLVTNPLINGSHIVRTVPTVTVPTVQPRIASPVVVTSGLRAPPVVAAQPITTAVVADNAYFTNAFKAVFMVAITWGFLWAQWAGSFGRDKGAVHLVSLYNGSHAGIFIIILFIL